MSFKSGYIAILGTPNVGKSTLLNALLGAKLAIVSEKPQTTRQKLLGIYHHQEGQLLFLDTPGLHRAPKALNRFMLHAALATIEDADLIYYLVDAKTNPNLTDLDFIQEIEKRNKPYLFIINKIDQVAKLSLLPLLQAWQEKIHPQDFFMISALRGEGTRELIQKSLEFLPEGPAYYPEEQFTDRDLRHLTAEIIREKIFHFTHHEIPYSVAVVIDEFKEDPLKPLDRISATIYVEKDSQKSIVIGRKGELLKKVGTQARQGIEQLTGRKVFLSLFVKVVKDWTKKDPILQDLGYR